ncbi:hypothetical protein OBK30_03245 [Empedobacter falsenii]
MNTYTLKNLSEFSELNEQMITLWNKKYKLFTEEKINHNTLFDHENLKKLMLISFLNESNKKNTIEKLSLKTISELQVICEFEIQTYLQINKNYRPLIKLMVCSCFSYDAKFFDTVLTICFKKLGIGICCNDIVFPFLSLMSEILAKYSIQESLISFSNNLIRKHLFYLIKSINQTETNNRKWMLFLPQDEFHDLELLYSYLFLKINNEKGIYLGENQSLKSIIECLEHLNITHIVIYISENYNINTLTDYIITIKKKYPTITIFLTSYKPLKEKITDKIPYININSPQMFNAYLKKIMMM